MKLLCRAGLAGACTVLALAIRSNAQSPSPPAYPAVTAPSESFFAIVRDRDREAARAFYRKSIDVKGMPVVASAEVADLALQRTYEIVTHLLAGRPDLLRQMVTNGMYLIIIGKDQVYTDMPEYRNAPNPAYQNERVRGTGGKPTSFGEENLLSLALDRYDDESIGVHEFCHTIDSALRSVDPTWSERKNATFRNAMSQGLWKNTYAASNPGEYWSEICQAYFDCNRMNNWNHGPIGTRERLKAYDLEAYALVKGAFNLGSDQDWRYTFLQKQPTVIPPPARFQSDPYYTKFTWAREFPVLGREAGDAALLKANDTIRKLFAYRHDLLKALIADGLKLVVLGRSEKLTALPEFKNRPAGRPMDARTRSVEYTPETRLLVVGEENLLGESADTEGCEVIRLMAKAFYRVAGTRPVDPNWEQRGRNVQQYELRVKRLDIQFDEKLKAIHAAAIAKGLWKDTAAAADRGEYWAEGVCAYFNANGRPLAAAGANHPVRTREALKNYDVELFALVEETMAYQDHEDWRYNVAGR